MNKMTKALLVTAIALASTEASAGLIQIFNANGVTESVSQQATASFDVTATTLSVTLTNNVDPTEFVQSMLDGIQFSLSSPAGLTLTGVNAPGGAINCSPNGGATPGSPCPVDAAPPADFGWGSLGLGGGSFMLGSGFDGVSTFAFRPYDIVNANYNIAGGGVGLSDPLNNPLLVGPVTFTFSVSGLGPNDLPEVTSATFLFGAPPPVRIQGVPEPGSLALIGIGLLSAVFAMRRMKRSGRGKA